MNLFLCLAVLLLAGISSTVSMMILSGHIHILTIYIIKKYIYIHIYTYIYTYIIIISVDERFHSLFELAVLLQS